MVWRFHSSIQLLSTLPHSGITPQKRRISMTPSTSRKLLQSVQRSHIPQDMMSSWSQILPLSSTTRFLQNSNGGWDPNALGVVDGDGNAGTSSNMWQYIVMLTYLFRDMADPNVKHVVEDAPNSSDGGVEFPDKWSDGDNEYMDSGEPMLCWLARTSAKHAIITSPPGQPPTQHPRVDYSVSMLSIHPIQLLSSCLREDVGLVQRRSRNVFCFKIQWHCHAWPAQIRSSGACQGLSGLLHTRSRRLLSWQPNMWKKLQRRL